MFIGDLVWQPLWHNNERKQWSFYTSQFHEDNNEETMNTHSFCANTVNVWVEHVNMGVGTPTALQAGQAAEWRKRQWGLCTEGLGQRHWFQSCRVSKGTGFHCTEPPKAMQQFWMLFKIWRQILKTYMDKWLHLWWKKIAKTFCFLGGVTVCHGGLVDTHWPRFRVPFGW